MEIYGESINNRDYYITKITNGTDKWGNTYKLFTVMIGDIKITAKAFCRFSGKLCYGELKVIDEMSADPIDKYLDILKTATEVIDRYAREYLLNEKWQ